MYSIVDIETTGNGINGNKITEISIFKYDGSRIIDEYTSLVNPESTIPYYITALTGIDDSMVSTAPLFREIAHKILDFTQDTIFVAHSVNFDYGVIRSEMSSINKEFRRKRLCTVRLSRKLFPGLNSYSLGKLCTSLSIPLKNRHRARGDAHATVLLLEKLLSQKNAQPVFKAFLNSHSREATIPPLLNQSQIQDLPEAPGVYYFKNNEGKTIYIGKAKNIKKRIWSHFYDKTPKETQISREIAFIDFELSGTEFLALLMESAAIKKYFPIYNTSQKRRVKQYGIFSYEDQKGIKHLAYNRIQKGLTPVLILYSINECREVLTRLCTNFDLCPRYCHLQESVEHCSHYSLKSCRGICKQEETIEEYNIRVDQALSTLRGIGDNILIKERGRNENEQAFVLIMEGSYKGYGFVNNELEINSFSDIEALLISQHDNPDIRRIVQRYLVTTKNRDIHYYNLEI